MPNGGPEHGRETLLGVAKRYTDEKKQLEEEIAELKLKNAKLIGEVETLKKTIKMIE